MAVRMKEPDADQVYFCENSCPASYSGCLDEDGSSMTEQEIAEFIRYSNPRLYEKLKGVRFTSSHLPCDDHPESDDIFGDGNTTASSSDVDCPYEVDFTSPSSSGPYPAAGPIVLEGRYHFTFYQHCEPRIVYCCSSPTCPNPRNVIPVGNYFAIVRDTALYEDDDRLTDYNRVAYYCLDCLDCIEEVVDREEHPGHGQKIGAPLVDGAQPDRNLILHKAQEIYPELRPKDFFFIRIPSEDEPESELGKASNSKMAVRLRRQKQLEIHRIAEELREKQLTAVYRMSDRMPKSDPFGLRISGPLESQPYRERYKKQGLEWINRLEGFEVKDAQDKDRATTNHAPASDLEMVDVPVCYCREPADDEPMLRCQSASCMLGPIHFRCSGLDRLLLDTDEYWCGYCVSDFTGDTKQIRGNRVLGDGISGSENGLSISDVEIGDADSGDMASGDEEDDSEVEHHHMPSAYGFVAVNRFRSQGE
ncbi:hypothetical protein AYL99_09264 [Fonsecaea erecta]|uniref:Zinc finger PHD-type domain-containing protein n=1 Tax=Fonsecaea erecta TaxID=1367422 RepID=A0A178ZAG4_9EURO|nr:hypothetical protein AYL99_09264 [Fonsecaea erecta]OAP56085.1 hypothetical protein AYL99_09264 [Fonsecaea erecta]